MSDDVYVRMEVPLGHPDEYNYAMEFYSWLPLEEGDRILVDDGDKSLTISFSTDNPEQDQQHANAAIGQVIADVRLRNLSEELIAGIQDPPDYSDVTDHDFLENTPHIRLAKDVVQFVVGRVNRLISYVRDHRGQYLLDEIPPMHYNVKSSLLKLNAKIRIGDSGEWKSWRPAGGVMQWTFKGYQGDRRRIVNKEDWPKIKEFVRSDSRPDLVRQLLTGAEAFADQRHGRAAITEAVTALEVAINNFARDLGNDEFGSQLRDRMDVASFKKQVEHMGLTGSVRYLLPVVLPENKVPTELLKNVQRALDVRGNVVHGGQREVRADELETALASIRELCLTLESLRPL